MKILGFGVWGSSSKRNIIPILGFLITKGREDIHTGVDQTLDFGVFGLGFWGLPECSQQAQHSGMGILAVLITKKLEIHIEVCARCWCRVQGLRFLV